MIISLTVRLTATIQESLNISHRCQFKKFVCPSTHAALPSSRGLRLSRGFPTTRQHCVLVPCPQHYCSVNSSKSARPPWADSRTAHPLLGFCVSNSFCYLICSSACFSISKLYQNFIPMPMPFSHSHVILVPHLVLHFCNISSIIPQCMFAPVFFLPATPPIEQSSNPAILLTPQKNLNNRIFPHISSSFSVVNHFRSVPPQLINIEP